MNQEDKWTAAVYSARNPAFTTAVVGKLWHRCTTVQFYTLLFSCWILRIWNDVCGTLPKKPPCQCLLTDSFINRHCQPPTVLQLFRRHVTA